MKDENRKKPSVKKNKKISLGIWTEKTGTSSANDKAWDKAVNESNRTQPDVFEQEPDTK